VPQCCVPTQGAALFLLACYASLSGSVRYGCALRLRLGDLHIALLLEACTPCFLAFFFLLLSVRGVSGANSGTVSFNAVAECHFRTFVFLFLLCHTWRCLICSLGAAAAFTVHGDSSAGKVRRTLWPRRGYALRLASFLSVQIEPRLDYLPRRALILHL
jgi:hypothetical protein